VKETTDVDAEQFNKQGELDLIARGKTVIFVFVT
jgi:Holliday junction resolvase-like predicted endonuclease